MQERLLAHTRDAVGGEHLHVVRLDVGDGLVDVVDLDGEVVAAGPGLVALHQVELLAAAVEPVAGPEVGPRELGESEDVAVERERGVRVGDTDRDVMDPGRLHG